MQAIAVCLILPLVSLLAAARAKENDENLVVTDEIYSSQFLIYTGDHDIVSLLTPLDSVADSDFYPGTDTKIPQIEVSVFFVEADTTPEGKRIDKGLYIFKDGKATKLLDNGRDAAAPRDDSNLVYFGASDGIYVYKNGSTDKYGSLTDSIIGIAKEKSGDVIYILTENHEVYNVSDSGNKKEKIDAITDAKQIVLDYANNLYFYSNDKQVHVLTSKGVKKITGLPANPLSVTLTKPPYMIDEGVPVVVNNDLYMVYPNGTSERSGVEFEPSAKPTAYANEVGIVLYYAHNKQIYRYNVMDLLFDGDLNKLRDYVSEMSGTN